MSPSIREFFDESSQGRDRRIAGNAIIDYEQRVRCRGVLELLEAKAGDWVLDVGCGNGRDLPPLVKQGCHCIGLDYSPGMIDEARRHLADAGTGGVPLLVGDATRLSFPDSRFDRVFSSEVIEHIPDYQRAIREMARVLKPGGTLVLTTPNWCSWYGLDRIVLEKVLRRKWNHPYDQWKTYAELVSALRAAGLRMTGLKGVCYVPGFILTYRLPAAMKRGLLKVVGAVEEQLSWAWPKNGYMLGVRAIKA